MKSYLLQNVWTASADEHPYMKLTASFICWFYTHTHTHTHTHYNDYQSLTALAYKLCCMHVLQLRHCLHPTIPRSPFTNLHIISYFTADTRKLKIPLFKKKYSGQSSFSYQCPVNWNNLLFSNRRTQTYSSFKSQLSKQVSNLVFYTSQP